MPKENHLSYKQTTEGAEKIEQIRQKYIELDNLITEATEVNDDVSSEDAAAAGRARALAFTKLEESRMWAIQSVVRLNNTGQNEDQGQLSGAGEDEQDNKKAA